MRTKIFLAPALAACLAATAAADTPAQADRALRDVVAKLANGERALTRAERQGARSARLSSLEFATKSLRDARRMALRRDEPAFASAWRDAGRALVRALTGQAEIHLQRGSLPLARERAFEALAVEPNDPRALNLVAMVDAEERKDIYDSDEVGAAAIERIRARRAAAGLPLRDRGMARRR